jgi:hypothetical protein
MDDFVGQMNAGQKPIGLRGKVFIAINGFFLLGTPPAIFYKVSNGIDNQSAGHLTGQMATHAVGNDI